MAVKRRIVGIVKADGSGHKQSDLSIAAINELRAGQVPENFGDHHHNLPRSTGVDTPEEYAAYPYKDGGL
jgi:hypothetical protein